MRVISKRVQTCLDSGILWAHIYSLTFPLPAIKLLKEADEKPEGTLTSANKDSLFASYPEMNWVSEFKVGILARGEKNKKKIDAQFLKEYRK